jgi:hypothetical protein
MAPKRTCKPIQETVVEERTQDVDVPSEAIWEEEQEDFEVQKNFDNHNDHETEGEQPTTVLFTPEQLEVLLKMDRPDFISLVLALKRGSSKGVGIKLVKLRNFHWV